MNFLIGFALGAFVTLYLFYRKAKKQRNADSGTASDKKSKKKEEEYL